MLVTKSGRQVAVNLANTQAQCDTYARQCGGGDFERSEWHTPAVALSNISVCTPTVGPLPASAGTPCVVRLLDGRDLSIPEAASDAQCWSMAKQCAQSKTGHPMVQAWFRNYPGGRSPAATYTEPPSPRIVPAPGAAPAAGGTGDHPQRGDRVQGPAIVDITKTLPQPSKQLRFKNACGETIKVAVRFQDRSGKFVAASWWTLPPGKDTYLDHQNQRVVAIADWWFYARSENYQWAGTDNVVLDVSGDIVPMKPGPLSGYELLTCGP